MSVRSWPHKRGLKKKISLKKNCDGKSKRNKIGVTLWWTCGQIRIITYKNEHWLY